VDHQKGRGAGRRIFHLTRLLQSDCGTIHAKPLPVGHHGAARPILKIIQYLWLDKKRPRDRERRMNILVAAPPAILPAWQRRRQALFRFPVDGKQAMSDRINRAKFP
jgi:hypothetical protein